MVDMAILTRREYPATFKRVIDGDTYELWFDYGFDSWQAHQVRLKGWDTPEIGHPLYDMARDGAGYVLQRYQFLAYTYKRQSGTYDMSLVRYVADITLLDVPGYPDQISLGQFLFENHLALPWDGKGKHPWEGHPTWEEAFNAIK
jgi:endonuclease YncB( thermonuclease family)